MKRAAIYVRVSSEEQKIHGLSVEHQIYTLSEYCEKNDIEVYDIYNDAGITARKTYTKRPGMLKMIKDAQNKKFDVILVTKLDRFFRSVGDYYEVMRLMNDMPWRAVLEDYETETSAGVFKVNIMLSVAQNEADRTSERVKAIMQYKKDCGEWIGTTPLGYIRKDKGLDYDPNTYEAMKKFFEVFRNTHCAKTARESIRDMGVYLSRSGASYVLYNPIYVGNEFVPAYITAEEHENWQSSRQRAPRIEGRVYLFSKLLKCGDCGKTLGGKNSRSSNLKVHLNYVCTNPECNKKACAEVKVEKLAIEELDKLIKKHTAEIKLEPKEGDVKKEIDKLNQKLARIGDRYEVGDLTKTEYLEKRNAVMEQINDLKAVNPPAAIEDIPNNWRDMYKMLDRAHKKAFWLKVASSIIVSHDNTEVSIYLN